MSSGIEKVECSSAPDEDGKDNATSREKNPESKRRQQVYGRRRFGIFNGSSLDLSKRIRSCQLPITISNTQHPHRVIDTKGKKKKHLRSNGLLDHNGFGLLEINSPRILRPD